jgi:hypothetical protein
MPDKTHSTVSFLLICSQVCMSASSFLIASQTWETLAGDVTLFALVCWAFQEQNKSGDENAHSLWAGILNLTQIWRLQTWV